MAEVVIRAAAEELLIRREIEADLGLPRTLIRRAEVRAPLVPVPVDLACGIDTGEDVEITEPTVLAAADAALQEHLALPHADLVDEPVVGAELRRKLGVVRTPVPRAIAVAVAGAQCVSGERTVRLIVEYRRHRLRILRA